MKRFVYLGLILITGLSFNTFAQESDSTGMPGDNFDLQGALNLFKQSKNLEDFEKKLNTEANQVNNLDLDGNNSIDYIRVVDKKDGDNHAVLLQIPVNSKETQDVAAIVVEKRSSSEAQLQIIGDATLYGEEKIMEPIDEKEVKKTTGPAIMAPTTIVFVNVWGWPCIQYIYDPFYDPWYSPYYWDYYPSWWNPWRPVYWHVYYNRMYHYHGWCHYTNVYHVPNAHRIYSNNKSNSATVRTRYAPQQAAYKTRIANNPSANGTKSRVEPSKSGTINRNPEGKKIENRQPATEPKVAPRPINPNTRSVEPVKRDPNVQPQPQQIPAQRSPERVQPQPQRQPANTPQRVQPQPQRQQPQRVQPQPQRQTQPARQAPVNRPANGGGRGGRR